MRVKGEEKARQVRDVMTWQWAAKVRERLGEELRGLAVNEVVLIPNWRAEEKREGVHAQAVHHCKVLRVLAVKCT